MPRKFERPKNLPEEIPIYHITPRDADADLLLKITAMKTNKTAVLPVYKEDLVEYLPNYFGRIFDKTKNYEFKENQLENNDYFEIKIPNLEDPKNVAIIFEEFFRIGNNLNSEENWKIDNLMKHHECERSLREFYWIANYFQHDSFLQRLISQLSSDDVSFCVDRAFAHGYCEKFAAADENRIYQNGSAQAVKNLLQPDFEMNTELFEELNQMKFGLQLCLQVGEYIVPITMDKEKTIRVVKEGRNIELKRCDYYPDQSGIKSLEKTFGNLFRPR